MATVYLFVYGTFRKNEVNSHTKYKTQLLFEQAWVFGSLYDTTLGYPILAIEGDQRVYGELIEVTDNQLKQFDRLISEKNTSLHRCTRTVYTDQGKTEAYMYVARDPGMHTQVRFGDWKSYLYEKKEELFYFAYGSCMDHKRFIEAGVNDLFQDVIGRGVLSNYKLQFLIGKSDGGRADIIEKSGRVEGKVYRINQKAREYLYKREGVFTGDYRPAFIDVTVNGEKKTNVLTFIVVNKEEEEIAPPNHYAEEILNGGMVH
ncbi:putative gamma-glutamylcyclotransferase YkqA [Lentibacillus sp. JNUCC-1]|uniref:gamma-glutamylcyclotransferase n=1 Tax=Lentibacillus sp. JNUCC-1 TaxID=2654513 RepID=UPI0012E8FB6E|nr:gamma-glutamylcyclotransferase [Lentibacillus sp. JNUCC-1]MUV37211.1 putative gamma-glutamylcyclotransferase YkqA [Lentibacillus sp. JNUCC-1]